jgi:hypothetical protein
VTRGRLQFNHFGVRSRLRGGLGHPGRRDEWGNGEIEGCYKRQFILIFHLPQQPANLTVPFVQQREGSRDELELPQPSKGADRISNLLFFVFSGEGMHILGSSLSDFGTFLKHFC